MKKSIIIFMTAAVFSVGVIVCGWIFVNHQIGQVLLTEETVMGNRDATDGLSAGFRADSADDLHWINNFDYNTNKTTTSFKRGKMTKNTDSVVYDDIRFNGWSAVPCFTSLKYGSLGELQQQKIHGFYNKIQQRVVESDIEEKGKIRLKDYLDFYSISFAFQFGSKMYNSDDALTGLKIYSERNELDSKGAAAYDREVELYSALNNLFKIPVIDNEYQEYTVKAYHHKTARNRKEVKMFLPYKTKVKKPLGVGEDCYEFDPIITIQEENAMDEKKWVHPDLSYETYDKNGESYEGKTAAQINLKNRMLFIVNNRTAKGVPVDVSQIKDGYGVYELPIEVTALATVRKGKKSMLVPDPQPESDKLRMVYPLDEKAEYVEMSLSNDHRYLAIFFVKDGEYLVDLVDADNWTSKGPIKLFPASKKMSYAWGDDGTLAATNHKGYVAVLTRTENKNQTYELLYNEKDKNDLDKAFFDTQMVHKDNSYVQYRYGIGRGLVVKENNGKVVLVQNLLVGNDQFSMRNAELECVILDKSGVIYRGRLKNNVADLEYDMSQAEMQMIRDEADSKIIKHMIKPVRTENWIKWKN